MHEIGTGATGIETEDGRADVYLNRPDQRNAMDRDVIADLTTAIDQVDRDESIRAITLLGKGPVFCAGMDLDMMHEYDVNEHDTLHRELGALFERIDTTTTPVVAGIKRAGIAGGFELSLPADFRILGEEAKYGVIEVNLGIFPHQGSTQRLPRLIGLAKAKELVLTGEWIDPDAAVQCGLVNEVVPDADVDDRARSLADDLTTKAPLGVAAALRAFQQTFDVPLEDGLAYANQLALGVYDTADRREGFEAQLEGREPAFEGR